VDTVALPPELRARLHGEHGAVVALHHPGGQLARRGEDPVGGEGVDELLEHLQGLHVVGGVQVVDGLRVLGAERLHVRVLERRAGNQI